MNLRVVRTGGGRLAVATVLLFGTAGLAACGDDDGGEIRNLTEETAPPSGTGSVGGSISGSGSGSGSGSVAETASPGASVSGSASGSGSGSASASEASASPTP